MSPARFQITVFRGRKRRGIPVIEIEQLATVERADKFLRKQFPKVAERLEPENLFTSNQAMARLRQEFLQMPREQRRVSRFMLWREIIRHHFHSGRGEAWIEQACRGLLEELKYKMDSPIRDLIQKITRAALGERQDAKPRTGYKPGGIIHLKMNIRPGATVFGKDGFSDPAFKVSMLDNMQVIDSAYFADPKDLSATNRTPCERDRTPSRRAAVSDGTPFILVSKK